MSSGEREDAELRTLVRRLIPVVKTRVLRAAELPPEILTEEIWTLAALYTIEADLAGGRTNQPFLSLIGAGASP